MSWFLLSQVNKLQFFNEEKKNKFFEYVTNFWNRITNFFQSKFKPPRNIHRECSFASTWNNLNDQEKSAHINLEILITTYLSSIT